MIIAFGYNSLSGKDTAATYLTQKYGFIRKGFADNVKLSLMPIYGWTEEHLFGSLKEVVDPYWGVSPREVMQTFATEACRNNLHKDIWVKSLFRFLDTNQKIVISDIRFVNEIEAIKKCGGQVIKIERNINKLDKKYSHISECELENYVGWDQVIDNNSSKEELYKKLDNLVDGIDCRQK